MFTTEPMHVLQHYRWYTSDGVEDDPDYVDFRHRQYRSRHSLFACLSLVDPFAHITL